MRSGAPPASEEGHELTPAGPGSGGAARRMRSTYPATATAPMAAAKPRPILVSIDGPTPSRARHG